MTRTFTWTARLALVTMAMAALGLGYLFAAYPRVAAAEHLSIDRTPTTLARGQYLFDHVAGCADCHSTRDWTKYGGPIVPGTVGKGGELFGKNLGLPGDFYAPNITPAGVGEWTDGELVRAITAGVSRHGEPLFPIMPYPVFGRMAKDDVEAIVAYMRTLPAIANSVPARTFTFPMQFIVRTLPTPPAYTTRPDGRDRIRLGEYLAAGCTDCHSPAKQGTPIPGMAFAGGTEFPLPDGGYVRSANLTPDMKTGLGGWSEEAFVTRFKAMAERPDVELKSAAQRRRNTVMPWKLLGGMTNEDLGAIFAYLRTLPPVENRVQKHSDTPLVP